MGIVFGMTGVEEPKYALLQSTPFEIRAYPKYMMAQVEMSSSDPNDKSAFRVLAKYIGVYGDAENEGRRSIATTAPRISSGSGSGSGHTGSGEKMAMTAPVVRSGQFMGFVLPFEYVNISDVPRPTDSRIQLMEVPERVVACRAFSGYYTQDIGRAQFRELNAQLMAADLVPKPAADSSSSSSSSSANGNDNENNNDEDMKWQAAQYHPPFTLPFMRRNEVWVELNEAMPPVRTLLQKLRNVK